MTDNAVVYNFPQWMAYPNHCIVEFSFELAEPNEAFEKMITLYPDAFSFESNDIRALGG